MTVLTRSRGYERLRKRSWRAADGRKKFRVYDWGRSRQIAVDWDWEQHQAYLQGVRDGMRAAK